jgi:hypothetical protein
MSMEEKIEADGWITVYQSPPATDPAVGVTYEHLPPESQSFSLYGRSRAVFTVQSVDGQIATDTKGNVWAFDIYGIRGAWRSPLNGEWYGFIRVPK